ncbi:hypothetical protein [Rhizorhabdus sp.]|uniref:hypothetical protein n=1 Tax=Rhizorhabdus sp. TaxID=1968843 RepID=UPI0035B39BA0
MDVPWYHIGLPGHRSRIICNSESGAKASAGKSEVVVESFHDGAATISADEPYTITPIEDAA